MARCTHVVQRHAGGEVEVDLLEEGGAAAIQIALLVGVACGGQHVLHHPRAEGEIPAVSRLGVQENLWVMAMGEEYGMQTAGRQIPSHFLWLEEREDVGFNVDQNGIGLAPLLEKEGHIGVTLPLLTISTPIARNTQKISSANAE